MLRPPGKQRPNIKLQHGHHSNKNRRGHSQKVGHSLDWHSVRSTDSVAVEDSDVSERQGTQKIIIERVDKVSTKNRQFSQVNLPKLKSAICEVEEADTRNNESGKKTGLLH